MVLIIIIIVFVINQVKKMIKMMKKMMTTRNIFIMSHRLEVMPLKCLSSSECAASTFNCVSLTFESILERKRQDSIERERERER